jgi:hypothetical protein
MVYHYKCELCGREVFRAFPDQERNISIQVAPYRLPVWCTCVEKPSIYILQKGKNDEKSD